MKQYKNIEFEIQDSIGIVWLNRPDKHNAMNDVMISEIIDCFEKINEIVDYISSNELNRDKDKELLHSMVRDISKNRDDIEHLISQKLFNFNDRPE